MLVTEEQASGMWCPFARLAFDGGGVNRWNQSLPVDEPYATNPVTCRCIASACMAWRWGVSEWRDPDKPLKAVQRRNYVDVVPAEKVEMKRGYCGLAGKP